MEKQWLVIYTKPRSEKKVEQRLLENGIEAYCPTYKTLKQWSDRKKKVEVPLLPSYVFVKVTELERIEVLNDPGVLNFIFWQGKPAIVRPHEVDSPRSEMHDLVLPETQVGDFLLIENGAFKGQEGKVKMIAGNHIVLILESLNLTIQIKRMPISSKPRDSVTQQD
jgi:transcriptional antiterminator RfaH